MNINKMFPKKDFKIEEDTITINDVKTEACDELERECEPPSNISTSLSNDSFLVYQPSMKKEPDEELFLDRTGVIDEQVDYPEFVMGHTEESFENEEFIVSDMPYFSKCRPEMLIDLPDSVPELKKIIEEGKCQMSQYLVEKEYLDYKVKMLTSQLNKTRNSNMENEVNGLKSYICLLSTNNTKLKNEIKVLRELVLRKETKQKKKIKKKVITLIMRNKDAESEFTKLRNIVSRLKTDNKALNSTLARTRRDLVNIKTKYEMALLKLANQANVKDKLVYDETTTDYNQAKQPYHLGIPLQSLVTKRHHKRSKERTGE